MRAEETQCLAVCCEREQSCGSSLGEASGAFLLWFFPASWIRSFIHSFQTDRRNRWSHSRLHSGRLPLSDAVMGREVLQPHAASDRLGLGAVCWRVRQPWKLCRWNILVGPVLGSSWTSVPFYFQINGSGYPLRLEKYKRECGAW